MMKPSFTSTAFLVALMVSVTAAAQQKPPAPVPTPPRGPVAQGADVALAREIQGAGLSTCQPLSDQVVKYMVDKSRSSGLLFVAPQEANYRVFSTSIAIESTSVTTYASASFAPYGNVGCGAALDLVTYFTDSCSVVSAFFQKQLQAANGGGDKARGTLGSRISMLDGGPNMRMFLMPAGTGCVHIKKEMLY